MPNSPTSIQSIEDAHDKSYPLLEKAPSDHLSPEFLEFLRANNVVEWESDQWLVIRNCKYWTEEKPWLTAFWIGYNRLDGREWWQDIDILWYEFGDWKWVKKAASKQTVKRFHIHLIKS